MKTPQQKRLDALHRMQALQQIDEAKLADLKKNRKAKEKIDDKVLIKHGLVAGFSHKQIKEALDSHIALVQRGVDRRAVEIRHLESVIRDAEPGSVRYV